MGDRATILWSNVGFNFMILLEDVDVLLFLALF
jgi:hypothetical protein